MKASNRGFALVIVIWILTLMSLMAGSFALSMRRESSVSLALKNNAEGLALAESGLNLAEYNLQQSDSKRRWLADGSIYRWLPAEGREVRIRIVSEAGKVDINTASQAQLSALLKAVTGDSFQQQHLLNSILDWRDPDDEPRPHGGERKQYQSAGLKYVPSDKPFQSVEELQLVLGMDEAIFTKIQPWITVYSGLSEVDLKLAAPELVQILESDMGDRHIAQNAATPGGDFAGQNGPGSLNDENQTYTIEVEVQMDDEASAAIEAVVRMQSQDFGQGTPQVFDWKLNPLAESLFAEDMEPRLIAVEDEFTNNN